MSALCALQSCVYTLYTEMYTHLCIHKMPSYYLDEDYIAVPEIQLNISSNKAVDVSQNRPLWRLMSTFVAMHS